MPNHPEIVRQYQACIDAGGVWLREDRGLFEIRGKDRAAWLNNLVTNDVKALAAGEGTYAFATNVKGRTIFDANLLVLDDRILLDIDRRWIEKATAHLSRYLITEDVQIADLTTTTDRLAVVGPRAAAVAEEHGVGNLPAMAWLQHVAVRVADRDVRIVRHDFAGLLGAEFLLSGDARNESLGALLAVATQSGLESVSDQTIRVLRIETGIPASVDDIDEEVVPPETGQIERGISYHKGCYLGQEVIERMRAHGVLARKLVGIRFEGDTPVPPQTRLEIEGREVGRVVSGCWSEALGAALSLVYLKSAHAKPGIVVRAIAGDERREGEVVKLPV